MIVSGHASICSGDAGHALLVHTVNSGDSNIKGEDYQRGRLKEVISFVNRIKF